MTLRLRKRWKGANDDALFGTVSFFIRKLLSLYPKIKTSKLMHIVCIRFACKNVETSPLSTRNVTDGAEP